MKVSLFVWLLFHNCLPTKESLVRRGVVQVVDDVCLLGCGSQETVERLFFCCNSFATSWHCVQYWLGFSSADTVVIKEHFVQFG